MRQLQNQVCTLHRPAQAAELRIYSVLLARHLAAQGTTSVAHATARLPRMSPGVLHARRRALQASSSALQVFALACPHATQSRVHHARHRARRVSTSQELATRMARAILPVNLVLYAGLEPMPTALVTEGKQEMFSACHARPDALRGCICQGE